MRAILTYHSIDESGSPISVSETAFRAHCRFLESGKVKVVPLEEIASVRDSEHAVALTFDDGFCNFAQKALPILESAGLASTLFVVSDRVGDHNDWGGKQSRDVPHLPLLTWEQLRDVAERGVSIGAHSRSHPALTSLSDAQLLDEVAGSLEAIQRQIGSRAASFAYPYGDVNERVAQVVRQHFTFGCTTELRALTSAEKSAQLPRLDMYYFREAGQLEAWGTTVFRSRLWLRGQGRRLRQLAQIAHTRQESAA